MQRHTGGAPRADEGRAWRDTMMLPETKEHRGLLANPQNLQTLGHSPSRSPKVSEGTGSAGTLASDFQPPEL